MDIMRKSGDSSSPALLYNTKIYNAAGYINSKSDLASKYSITDVNITYFNINGNDIEIFIDTPYNVNNGAFMGMPITNYEDLDGMMRGIGDNSFRQTQLTDFDGRSVTSITDYAFYYCTQLTKVLEFPNLTSIQGVGTFRLSGVRGIIANNLTDWCNINGSQTFRQCSVHTIECRSLVNLGVNSGDNSVFLLINAGGCIATFPKALSTNNGGSPDGDIQYLMSRGASVAWV